ncbi:hypothetical protein Lesp02_21070 [Lentzea sp. NBRC 105346]|uniref:aKG-HExxH-type peptide beta-hydroxylase n=1 Tax=Lentzea sp. NBRC 105346 TaxID=3032205 RepID=UPI0024A03827|nr:HEXXH motif-containing putative peptide modification protein [Lentzea sp. NBRC 105346]GLZ29917.1 hypothetical protein Lesp02_21070 [Lentzea sp. NBRC 105346]
MKRIPLSWEAFDLLATGRSDARSLATLKAGQFSKHMLLLRLVKTETDLCLDALEELSPDRFTEIVSDPHFGAWAARTLRSAAKADLGDVLSQPEHRRYLSARFGDDVISLLLNDFSPYRDLPRLPPAGRLPDDAVSLWQDMFTEAWTILARDHAEHAAEISSCIVSLVPLQHNAQQRFSATARDAFGAVALTTPTGGTDFAVTLVHECQHTKLDALLDLVELYDPSDTRRYYSPWRADPRPNWGVLHGTYAFLGVAEFWRLEGNRFEFAHTAEQLRRALDVLDTTRLTESGRRFARGMRSTVDSWAVPDEPEATAAVERHWTTWQAANA